MACGLVPSQPVQRLYGHRCRSARFVVTGAGALGSAASRSVDRLSERERDVIALMAEGYTDRAIADRLIVSIKTVESHVHTIFTKLDLVEDPSSNRRVQAVVRWLRS
jgi:DNA-binding NarL/FixJ family response regulator